MIRDLPYARRVVWAVVALVAIVAALVIRDHLSDDRPRASVGSTLPAADALRATTSSFLLLPTVRLDVRATRALDDVPGDAAVRTKRAPDGGSFVGLDVSADPSAAPARQRFGTATGASALPAPVLALLADGRRYRIEGGDSGGVDADGVEDLPLRAYVAVAGTPARLELEVTYAGAKQTVDLRTGEHVPGRFAELYRAGRAATSCGTPTYTAGFGADLVAAGCRLESVQRTPYYPGRGWAKDGRTWLVARVGLSSPVGLQLRTRDGDRARYEVYDSGEPTFRLGDAAPAQQGAFSTSADGTSGWVMFFDASSTQSVPLTVTTAYDSLALRPDRDVLDAPADPTVRVSWRAAP